MVFNGMMVITTTFHTVAVARCVRRGWRERLWSWPWRPWRVTKIVSTQEPDPHVYQFGDKLSMHPATYARLKAELESR